MGVLDRHAAALAAVRRLLSAHGVDASRLETWKDGSNLLVRPAPAPLILRVATFTARVRGDPMPYLRREVALVSWLAERGAPVMAPAEVMPPGPFLVDGWGIAAWRFEAHELGAVPGSGATLVALDSLHDALREYRGDLPLLGPATSDLDRALAFAVAEGIILADDAAGMVSRRDLLVAELLAADPERVPQHGDAFPRNTVVTNRGVVWIDLEDACLGPRSWDLVVLARNSDDPVVRREAQRRHGARAVAAAWELRDIQAGVWQALHDARIARGW